MLDCCFLDATTAVAGGLDRAVVRYDLATGFDELLGTHGDAVRCIEAVPSAGNVVASGGWDRTLR